MMTELNPDYGDCMTLEEFLEGVACTAFTDYDGWGYPSDGTHHDRDTIIRPSNAQFGIPYNTTHILWFNK